MFYKVLFLLACYNLYKSVKGFLQEDIIVQSGKCKVITNRVLVSAGMTVLFYVMVLAVCLVPSLLF